MKEDFMSAVITWAISIVAMAFAVTHLIFGEEVAFWFLFIASMFTFYVAYTEYIDWRNQK